MNIDIAPPHTMAGPPQTGGVGHGAGWGEVISIHIDIKSIIDTSIIINIKIAIHTDRDSDIAG